MAVVKLKKGEKILFQVEADFWNRGNNPIQKALGNLFRIIGKILGFKIKGHLTVTTERVIETSETIRCYCVPTSRHVKVLTRHGVKEFGYEMQKVCGLFFPTYFLYYEGDTQSTMIAVENGSDEKMMEYLDQFHNALK